MMAKRDQTTKSRLKLEAKKNTDINKNGLIRNKNHSIEKYKTSIFIPIVEISNFVQNP
jgi:hypothetical protein